MSALYPIAKTFEQRAAEDEERRRRQRRQLPSVPWLIIPLFGGAVGWVALQFMQIVPEMWQTGSSAFIFFSFAMWLGVAGMYTWWAMYSHRVIYAHGRSLLAFWLGYIALLGLALAVHVTGILPNLQRTNYVSLFALVYTGLLVLLVATLLFMGRKKRSKKR